tara:strand:+ start:7407 stop:7787 length:381 start_codon:yes stop_codon:yes gene_type:complete
MRQRVNIQYSVELDELDKEVNRLFDNTGKKLAELTPCSFSYVPMDLSGIEMIDDLRQKLARIDIALGDVQNIVEGYVRFKSAPPEQEHKPPEPSGLPDVGDLQDKVAQFKEMLDAQSNQEPQEENE